MEDNPSILRDQLGNLIGDHAAVERELGVPPRRYYSPWDSGTTYGVNSVLNRYCGLSFPGEWPLAGFWAHGWVPSFAVVHPYQVSFLVKQGEYPLNLVPRRDLAEYLLKHGFPKVKAVGLPILYVPESPAPRIPRSILVMPYHSQPDFRADGSRVPRLVEILADLRQKFELVVGCVHPTCLKSGLWIDDFKKAGMPYVSGANMRDANSLYRMRHLFKRFEAVVTNGFGSLLPYAAFCGARVGVTGNFAEDNREVLLKDIFYGKNPDVLDLMLEALSEKSLKRSCPFLWNDPVKGEPLVEWGRKELGWDCRLSPEEAIEVFGLRPKARLTNAVRRFGKKAAFAVNRRLFARLARP